MKRIITYVYEYQNGMRRSSAGVFKLDLLGDDCRIQLNLQGSVPMEEQGKVYFVVKQGGGELEGIAVGETTRYRGAGGGNWMVRQIGICGSHYSFDDVHGMAVRYPSGRYLASCWEEEADERFLRGDFTEAETAKKQEIAENTKIDEKAGTAEKPKANEKQNTTEKQKTDEKQNITEKPKVNEIAEAEEKSRKTTGDSKSDEKTKIREGTEGTEKPEDIENPEIHETYETYDSSENSGIAKNGKDIDVGEPEDVSMVKIEHEDDESERSMELCAEELSEENLPAGLEEGDTSEEEIQKEDEEQDSSAETPQGTLQRMDISDIRSLPKKNWHLCSNSFLIHGFFSYHYLVRKDIEENGNMKSYLGVPGTYARAERAMAMLFGFPEFEMERRNSKDTQIPEGSFGYWFCQLEM